MRNQILDIQKQFGELKDELGTARKLLDGTSNDPRQYLMNIILEKDQEIKEALRIKKRQEEDYSLLRGEFFRIKEVFFLV